MFGDSWLTANHFQAPIRDWQNCRGLPISYLVALLVALLVGAVSLFAIRAADNTFTRVRESFTYRTSATLTDLFFFIDPKRIWWMASCFTLCVAMVVGVLTDSAALAFIAGVVATFLPRKALAFLRARRERTFLNQLPDALQGIAGSLRAGSSINQAIDLFVAESNGPVAQELDLLQREIRMGVSFDDAMQHLYRRMPMAETQLVSASMRIARETGGNLASVLERLSDTLRRKLEMEGKIRSLTAQGKAQGWVMSLLPIFLIVVLYQMEPVHMARLFTEPIGWGVCAFIVVMEYIGYKIIIKIVSIDV